MVKRGNNLKQAIMAYSYGMAHKKNYARNGVSWRRIKGHLLRLYGVVV